MTSVYAFFGGSFTSWLEGSPEREGVCVIPDSLFMKKPEGRKPVGRLSEAAKRIIFCTIALSSAQKRAGEWTKEGQPHEGEWGNVFDYVWDDISHILEMSLKVQLRLDLIADGIDIGQFCAVGFVQNGDLYVFTVEETIPPGPTISI